MEYAVFSRRLLTGTVSDLSPAIRIAWITVLFEAERLRGKVKLPVRDLAKMASITTPEAAEALRVFQEPDPYSSTKEHDGRRLLPIEGEEDWYTVATWDKHAEERAAFFNRLRQQRFRENNASSRTVTEGNAALRSVTNEPKPTLESKSLEQQAARPRRSKPPASEADAAFNALWAAYPRKLGRHDARRHFGAQVKIPDELPLIESAIRNYARHVAILGTEDQFILHGSSFFNHRWREFADGTWTPPKPPAPMGRKVVNEGPPEAPHHPRFVS